MSYATTEYEPEISAAKQDRDRGNVEREVERLGRAAMSLEKATLTLRERLATVLLDRGGVRAMPEQGGPSAPRCDLADGLGALADQLDKLANTLADMRDNIDL